jgi:carbamoyltransferase
VQVAVRECGFIYELLLAFRGVTGVGVLLNTSFNGRGEPIVETPEDALMAFVAMNIKYLYLQGMLLQKR